MTYLFDNKKWLCQLDFRHTFSLNWIEWAKSITPIEWAKSLYFYEDNNYSKHVLPDMPGDIFCHYLKL